MVNVAPGFDRMPEVIDGASDFFYELFGPKAGQHARTAVGMAELPHGIPVKINGEFELKAKDAPSSVRPRKASAVQPPDLDVENARESNPDRERHETKPSSYRADRIRRPLQK